MDEFINSFSRLQQRRDDEALKRSSFITDKKLGQTLSISELSPIEKDVYGAWWDELDPFGLGIVVDQAMHPFLQASGLVEETLEQIIDCYAGESRYTEDQFYAILRLVAHGQNGRKINRDLVALGAPLANFDQEAIESLFCRDDNNQSTTTQRTGKDNVRNTWWGQSLTSQQKDTPGTTLFLTSGQQWNQHQPFDTSTVPSYRHSYTESQLSDLCDTESKGHISSDTTSLTSHQTQPSPFDWAEQALATSTTQHENSQQHPFNSPHTTTTNSKSIYSHSRSRSVPYALQDMILTPTPNKQDDPAPSLMSSRSFVDTTDFYKLHQQQQSSSVNHGQSLLLTQKFIPPANTTKSTNPFDDDDDDDGKMEGGVADQDNTLVDIEENDHGSLSATGTTTLIPIDIDDQHGTLVDVGENDDEFLSVTKTTTATLIPINMDDQHSTLVDVGENDDESLSVTKTATATLIPINIDDTTPTISRVTPSSPLKVASTLTDHNENMTISPQSSKPLKRSQSQHAGQKHSFMSQGAFLLATSSPSSSSFIKFPMTPIATTTFPSDNTDRLLRHRSATTLQQK